MDEDFPAAHSMNTQWFAVDADGRVGVFLTGNCGAVPLLSCAEKEAASALDRIEATFPPGEVIHELIGRLAPHTSDHDRHQGLWDVFEHVSLVVFLASPEAARDLEA